ncbi:PIN domain-containing protein [Desulfonema limicola]|uniref:PIN domain-containing protein n=1 Tax=Desulfonema limicola TaxID=45656 RepID=A0A975BEB5_9BACT|nr:PIN domain-containing protein [Desulfonema limicola]
MLLEQVFCEAIQKFLSFSTFIPINENITEKYAVVRKKLRQTDRPLPENDIWIAAICLELQDS